MIDLQIIRMRDVLPVKNATPAVGVTPRSLILSGSDFRYAEEVYINEGKSPSVVIMDNTTLIAQVPFEQEGPIRSIAVVSSRLTRTQRSTIDFRLGDTPTAVSGLDRLVQLFLKIVLQTPGTDSFAKDLGGGLLGVAGKLQGSPTASANSMAADVKLGVERTRRQIMSIQANAPALALSEKLLYARLLETNFVPQEQSLYCVTEVKNQAMQSSVVDMEV